MRLHRSLSTFAVLAALSACECDDGVQQVQPELGLNDESIDFGLVAVGDTALQILRLEALSSADIELTVTLDDNDAGAFSFPIEAPDVVPGSGFVDIRLAFTPPDAEVYAATLDIVTNDPDVGRGRRRVLLSGEGKRPQISVTPTEVELSAIACPPTARSERCEDSASATVENIGLVTLTLGQVEVVAAPGGTLVPNLTLAKLVNTSQLAAGEKLEVPLRWKPADGQGQPDPEARYEVLLRVPSNDPANPVVDVPVFAHADPNTAPEACINVVSVTRREYQVNAQNQVEVATVAVPTDEWWLDTEPGVLQVRPGYTVVVSTQPVTGDVCTFDLEGDDVTPAWSVSSPEKSRAVMTPDSAEQSSFEIDAVGEYEVTLVASDSLRLKGSAQLAVNAIPRDDLFVELSWDSPSVDLDLHLLVDAGPRTTVEGVTTPYSEASLFCRQDTFFSNPAPSLFNEASPVDDPRLLRDDQGSAGRLESISLTEAPEGSRFRVAVHYYAGLGDATPSLTVRLKGETFGPFTPSEPMTGPHELWVGAELEFPVDDNPEDEVEPVPVATELDVRETGHEFIAVGLCN